MAESPSLRSLPGLVGSAVRLVWAASPVRSAWLLGGQLVASLALFGQVLLVDQVLDAFLAVGRGASLGDAVVPVVLIALLTVATTVAFTVTYLQQRVLGELVARSIWDEVLDVSQAVDLSAYDDPDFHDHVERVRKRAATETQYVVQTVVLLVGDALGIVAGTAAMIAIAPLLAPVLLVSGVPLLLTSRRSGRLEFDFAVAQSARDRERGYLQDVLVRRDEAAEARAFSLASMLRGRWADSYGAYLGDLRRHVQRRTRLALVGSIGAGLLTAGAMLLAVLLVARGELDVAAAGAALVALRLLSGRVVGASRAVSTIFESAPFLRDLRDFRRRAPVRTPGDTEDAPASFDRLTVSGVTFTYPGAERPSLRDVSVEIGRGEVVALVGENGSGKSTLAKLLADLYEPDSGTIAWDGVDVRRYDPDSVRRRIAVVFQDFIRYRFSARTNIALGRADAGDDDVRDAARHADADAFLSALPAGYDTVLSTEYEGGADLSLGQWQRVALARAFVRDAPFVILDEPSASLDARSEHALFERIRSLLAGRTVLLISHRFPSVRMADRIYVLSEGRVVEHGDHASLLKLGGLYADLFELQASGYLAEDHGE